MDKHRLKQNIIKFTIGIILLGLAFGYLQTHTAEKESRNTGVSVMVDRISTSFKKLTGKYNETYEYRKSMLSHYEEISYVAESTHCFTDEMKTELSETYTMLQNESIDHFKSYKDNYYYIRSQYKKYVDENCQGDIKLSDEL